MGICDKASEREQFDLGLTLRQHAEHLPDMPATGACHWCDALLPAGARFCDRDRLQDWQREQDARRRGGLLA